MSEEEDTYTLVVSRSGFKLYRHSTTQSLCARVQYFEASLKYYTPEQPYSLTALTSKKDLIRIQNLIYNALAKESTLKTNSHWQNTEAIPIGGQEVLLEKIISEIISSLKSKSRIINGKIRALVVHQFEGGSGAFEILTRACKQNGIREVQFVSHDVLTSISYFRANESSDRRSSIFLVRCSPREVKVSLLGIEEVSGEIRKIRREGVARRENKLLEDQLMDRVLEKFMVRYNLDLRAENDGEVLNFDIWRKEKILDLKEQCLQVICTFLLNNDWEVYEVRAIKSRADIDFIKVVGGVKRKLSIGDLIEIEHEALQLYYQEQILQLVKELLDEHWRATEIILVLIGTRCYNTSNKNSLMTPVLKLLRPQVHQHLNKARAQIIVSSSMEIYELKRSSPEVFEENLDSSDPNPGHSQQALLAPKSEVLQRLLDQILGTFDKKIKQKKGSSGGENFYQQVLMETLKEYEVKEKDTATVRACLQKRVEELQKLHGDNLTQPSVSSMSCSENTNNSPPLEEPGISQTATTSASNDTDILQRQSGSSQIFAVIDSTSVVPQTQLEEEFKDLRLSFPPADGGAKEVVVPRLATKVQNCDTVNGVTHNEQLVGGIVQGGVSAWSDVLGAETEPEERRSNHTVNNTTSSFRLMYQHQHRYQQQHQHARVPVQSPLLSAQWTTATAEVRRCPTMPPLQTPHVPLRPPLLRNNLQGMRGQPMIGIDLGTTKCCLAVCYPDGSVKKIEDRQGNGSTPSRISYTAGLSKPLCGAEAKDPRYLSPENFLFSIKKFLQSDLRRDSIPFYSFGIIPDNQGTYRLGKQEDSRSVEEVLTDFITHVKAEFGDEFLQILTQNPEPGTLLALPSYFTEEERLRCVKACRTAGFNVFATIPESAAAALAYNSYRPQGEARNYLFFDLGADKFEASVVQMKENHIDVKGTGGGPGLGGDEFDNLIMEYCIQQFRSKHGADLTIHNNADESKRQVSERLLKLRRACENQKRTLSQITITEVVVDKIYNTTDLSVRLDRNRFNSLIKPLLDEAFGITTQVIRDSGLKEEDIQHIVLLGGSCLVPEVRDRLRLRFGEKKIVQQQRIELVAHGAALAAYHLVSPGDSVFRGTYDLCKLYS